MVELVQFRVDGKDPGAAEEAVVLVEIPEGLEPDGIQPCSASSSLSVYAATERFNTVLRKAIRPVALTLTQELRDLPDPPTEASVSFGLKVTGGLGTCFITAGGESHFSIQLSWRKAPT